MKRNIFAVFVLLLVFAILSVSAFAAFGSANSGKLMLDGDDSLVAGIPREAKRIITVVSNSDDFRDFKRETIVAINNLRKTDFEKLRELKKGELSNLRDLNASDVNNLSQLRRDRIQAIASMKRDEIEKIKGLRSIEMWKVSQLRKVHLGKLLDFNSADVNVLVSVLPTPHLERLLDLNREEIAALLDLNADELAQLSLLDSRSLEEIAEHPKQAKFLLKAKHGLDRARWNYFVSRERFEFARERFLEAKENFANAKQKFLRVKEKIKDANFADRNALREQLRDNAQRVLLNQVNAILNHLEAVQGKNVDLGDINALIAQFTALQSRLEDQNLSQQELVDIAKQIRHSWGQLKPKAQRGIETALNNRLENLIAQSNKAYDKMNSLVSSLKQQGKDVNALEAALAEYQNKLKNIEDLNVPIAAMIADGNFSQAKEQIKLADKELKESFKLLKKIISDFKKAQEAKEENEED